MVYSLTEVNNNYLCRALSIHLQRNCMLRHDYRACLARMFLPMRMSVLRKYAQIRPSTLNELRYVCHKLPHGLNLHWLFITNDIASVYKQIFNSVCQMSLQKTNISKILCKNAEVHYKESHNDRQSYRPVGGGRSYVFSANVILPLLPNNDQYIDRASGFHFVDHVNDVGLLSYPLDKKFVHVDIPLQELVPHLPVNAVHKIAKIHQISISSHVPKVKLPAFFESHSCENCSLYVSIFSVTETVAVKRRQQQRKRRYLNALSNLNNESQNQSLDRDHNPPFPPPPLSQDLSHTIISDFCNDSHPGNFEEAGCAVCGKLVPLTNLSLLKSVKGMLNILEAPGVTRIERKKLSDPIQEYKGPVLDYRCDRICGDCRACIRKGNVPRLALAKGLWLGNVPKELSDLRFIEKMLISRIQLNCCFVRVASGMRKMTSHVVAFQSPIPKIYHALPPPIEDLDEILAILFTGPCKPTEKDFERTPLLVRRNYVIKALEWLKINHSDYQDLEISQENLAKYPEDGPPVSIEYRQATTNKVPEGTSVFDNECEDGTESGDCPFVVHGLTGEHLDTQSINSLKAIALQYMNRGGKMLAVGHSAQPESIYNNPELYPQIFPWLFPYGLGGIGSTSLSDAEHKKHLLMFHDKRFQTDIYFPFVAFSHAQIKASTTGSFLLADTNKFYDITNRLLDVDQQVLSDLANRLSKGDIVKPDTPAEKECFQIIRDLDHIGGKVNGSTTSKKYMRNEIWSLIAYKGAPSWYITLSPADVKHPICLYFADTKESFNPILKSNDERIHLIAKNPVAGARFFHFMVELFIKHVLGLGTNHPGVYGETSAYYGTIEQQGR